jgi:AcrR family transcriptional regulator
MSHGVGVSDLSGGKRSGGKRGRPRLLTEDRIVEAALNLAEGAGRLENVSMRALAQELGAPVTTIYNYVSNREALYELVVNHALRPVRIPLPEAGSWEDRLRQLERDARRAVAKYPGVSFDRRGGGAAETTRLADGAMSILTSAGFDSASASLAFATLFTFMMGQIEMDAMAMSASSPKAFEGVTTTARLSRDEVFEFGFDAVIEGLKAKLPRQRSAARTARKRLSR